MVAAARASSPPRRSTRKSERLTARQRALVERYLPMAKARAAHWRGGPDGPDLEQEAAVALCKAARAFVPGRGIYPHVYFRRWLIGLEARWHRKMGRGRELLGIRGNFEPSNETLQYWAWTTGDGSTAQRKSQPSDSSSKQVTTTADSTRRRSSRSSSR